MQPWLTRRPTPIGVWGAVEAVVGQAHPAVAHGTVFPRGHIGHAVFGLEARGDTPAGIDRLVLHPEALADRSFILEHPDADGIGPDFVSLRKKR